MNPDPVLTPRKDLRVWCSSPLLVLAVASQLAWGGDAARPAVEQNRRSGAGAILNRDVAVDHGDGHPWSELESDASGTKPTANVEPAAKVEAAATVESQAPTEAPTAAGPDGPAAQDPTQANGQDQNARSNGEGKADDGTDGCKCFPINQNNTEDANKFMIQGQTISYPKDFGDSCKAWDDNVHPDCKKGTGNEKGEGSDTKQNPVWCTYKFCYVDPCSCDVAKLNNSAPSVSRYSSDMDRQHDGKYLHYSYATCGFQDDDFLLKIEPNACRYQKDEKTCDAKSKCAWRKDACVGQAYVDPTRQCNGSEVSKDSAFRQGASVLVSLAIAIQMCFNVDP